MMSFRVVLAACLCISVFAKDVVITDCSGSDAWGKLLSSRITPNPISLNGAITVGVSAKIFKDLKGAELDLNVDIKRHIPIFGYISLPCPEHANCKFDACSIAQTLTKGGQCPPELKAAGIPCTCDTIKAGIYTLKDTKTWLHVHSGILSLFASGSYKARVTVVDRKTNKQVGCLDAAFDLDS